MNCDSNTKALHGDAGNASTVATMMKIMMIVGEALTGGLLGAGHGSCVCG